MKSSAKNLLITGRPGIGKTTAVLKAVEELRRRGVHVGGFISREVREAGVRTGFVIVDLSTGEEAYLARVGGGLPKVGKYTVLVSELERVGVRAVLKALESSDVVVIDEIGPMELYSQLFKETVVKALNSLKPVIATIHFRAREDPFGRMVLSRDDVTVISLLPHNRDKVPRFIVEQVLTRLKLN